MHWPRAAERHQREVARIDPAIDRDDAQGTDHLLVRDADDALRGFERVEAEGARKLLDRGGGRIDVQIDPAGERR